MRKRSVLSELHKIVKDVSLTKYFNSASNYCNLQCDVTKPLWICLQCGEQGCGKEQKQHAAEHYRKPHSDCHCMVTDTHNWNVWCYQCEIEVYPSSK